MSSAPPFLSPDRTTHRGGAGGAARVWDNLPIIAIRKCQDCDKRAAHRSHERHCATTAPFSGGYHPPNSTIMFCALHPSHSGQVLGLLFTSLEGLHIGFAAPHVVLPRRADRFFCSLLTPPDMQTYYPFLGNLQLLEHQPHIMKINPCRLTKRCTASWRECIY
jgi:hypothetical protein